MEGKLPILVNYGIASKSIFEMNDSELKVTQKNILHRAKEKAFSKGLPIYYSLDGKIVAEYSDGRIEFIKDK